MKSIVTFTIRRTGGWLYASGLCLAMGLLSIWLNLMSKSPDYASLFAILCIYLTLTLPLLTMRADIAPLTTLVWHTIGCALLVPYIAFTAPSPAAFTCLAGFYVTGCVLACLCALIAALVRRAVPALLLSLALLIVLREASELGAALATTPAGVAAARLLIALSPYSLLNNFINALFDLSALAIAAALCALLLYLARRTATRVTRRALAYALAFVALCVALAFAPLNLTLFDVTDQRLTTASEPMAYALRGLDEPVTVYQIAPVGLEDVWVKTYLKKLAERHRYITYRLVDPVEDPSLAELSPSDNSLVVEAGDTRVVLDGRQLYADYPTATGTLTTFEIEGALLTALTDATQIGMTYAGIPPGQPLNTEPLALTDAQTSTRAIAFVLGPVMLMLGALTNGWRKRKHAD